MDSRFGVPLNIRSRSADTHLIVEPVGGINVADAPTDIAPSQSPSCDNMIFQDNAVLTRPGLTPKTTNHRPMTAGVPVLGGIEVTDVVGTTYPLISGRTQFAWYSNGSWSLLSYVAAYGVNAQPAAGATDYWDITQTYLDVQDENIAIAANESYQTLYCWESGTTVFSTLTGAPMAKCIESFNNFVLAGNIQSGGSRYVQRVQWNDRGSASSWTGGLAGFEDLLSMHGGITRLMGQENRVVVMGEQEIWQGLPVDYPFLFSFQPLDRNVGCPYPWTAAVTPAGIFFLGHDLQVYWLSKSGGPAQPVGHRVHKFLRDNIDTPERSWGVYSSIYNQYQLYFPAVGGAGYPERAVFLNVDTNAGAEAGAWAPQSFNFTDGTPQALSRGFEAFNTSSSGTTWGGAGTLTWGAAAQQWNQMGSASEERAVFTGTSGGTMYFYAPQGRATGIFPVDARWRSLAYAGFAPERQKALTEIRIDYTADSNSSLTLRTSTDQGGTFDAGVALNLPATSGMSQLRAFVYTTSRYPCWEVLSQSAAYKLYRFWVSMRVTGR